MRSGQRQSRKNFARARFTFFVTELLLFFFFLKSRKVVGTQRKVKRIPTAKIICTIYVEIVLAFGAMTWATFDYSLQH